MKFDSETLVIARAISILERRMATRCNSTEFSSPEAAKTHARLTLSERPFEVFACYFLDCRHCLIQFEELFQGTINGASVHPRVVVRRALELNAAAVIFVHNHPSGIAEPSSADMDITQRLKEALSLVEIRALDHLVVGAADPVSFAERGLL